MEEKVITEREHKVMASLPHALARRLRLESASSGVHQCDIIVKAIQAWLDANSEFK